MLYKVLSCVLFLSLFSCTQKNSELSDTDLYSLEDDYVPDEETAIKIAEVVWLNIYGERIYRERPFKASLLGDTLWVIEGTLEEGRDGGTVYAKIRKSDCQILKITHTK